MRIPLFIFLLGALAACQSATTPTTQPTAVPATAMPAPTPTAALTTEDARAAVRRYVDTQPDSARYVLGSASILDADASWQVLVPRSDWADRMPNKAAFDVDKATGTVTRRAVK